MTMIPLQVSIIIVSHNTREMTLACLRSIFSQRGDHSFEVIVLDNCSTDGSWEAIEREFPDVQPIKSLENLGFARANNAAAKRATGRFILLLNPDTLVLDQAIDRLVEFAMEQPEAGIWGGRTIFADGSLNPSSCWRFMSIWSVFVQAVGLSAIFPGSERFNPEEYGCWARDTVREVDFVAGCFLLITRELWEKLGGFDTRFFMYAEEADLCYRARQNGARPLFTPEPTILHYGGASEATLASKIKKIFSGKVTYVNKHWSEPARTVSVLLLVLHSLSRAVGYSVLAWISGSDAHRKSAREWRQAWKERHEWARGYGADSPS